MLEAKVTQGLLEKQKQDIAMSFSIKFRLVNKFYLSKFEKKDSEVTNETVSYLDLLLQIITFLKLTINRLFQIIYCNIPMFTMVAIMNWLICIIYIDIG